MRAFIRRLAYFLRRDRREAELREEMEFHRTMLAQRSPGNGGFGNATLAREDARAVWITPWIESVLQDVRYAARSLRREPGFAAMAVATLGAAIGVNASLFAAFNATMWRPWPVADPARVVVAVDRSNRPTVTLAEYAELSRHARMFSGFIATRCIDGLSDGCTVSLDGRDARADFVTANYFDVLGLRLERGAGFAATATGSAEALAVISFATWQTRFGGAADVIGRGIRVDDVPFTIAGIAPARFHGTSVDRSDLWLLLSAMPLLRPDHVFRDDTRIAALAGRLAPGVTREQARAEIEGILAGLGPAPAGERRTVRLIDTTFFSNPRKRDGAYPAFALMLAAVLLVLALACANVGNLLLARAAARRREIGVRLTIGASRGRLVRQLLTESLLLAAAAGIVGLAVASVVPALVMQSLGGPLSFDFAPDGRVLALTSAVVVLTCLGFGLAPALHGSRERVSTALAARSSLSAGRVPLRAILLSIEVAIGIVLLFSASLMVRGIAHATSEDGGIAENIRVVRFDLPASTPLARSRAFAAALVARHDLGEGARTGWASLAPFESSGRLWTDVRVAGRGPEPVIIVDVSRGYFEALGVPLHAGSFFSATDVNRNVAVVNEAFARQFWPGGSALGQSVSAQVDWQIIGVVGDAATYYGNVMAAMPTLYVPITNRVVPRLVTRGLGAVDAQALTDFATSLEPRAKVSISSLADVRGRLLAPSRAGAAVSSVLALLAVTLAAVGVFTVFAYSVQQRYNELGIRLALGARTRAIVGTIVGGSAYPLALGVAAGAGGAVAATRVLRRFLFGISPVDPIAVAVAVAVLVLAAGAATVVPARRASRIDPLVALRHE